MSMRIGTAPVSWGILEFEGWTWPRTYDEVLDEIAGAGYAGTELGPYGFLPTDAAELRREVAERNLALLGAFTLLPLSDPSKASEAIESSMRSAQLLSDAGAPFLVLADAVTEERLAIAGRATEANELSEEQWKRAADLVMNVAAKAAPLGLQCVFHHHGGTYVETPRELDILMRLTDPALVGICLDTGHYLYGGGDPVECVQRYTSRIRHIHLKDICTDVLDDVRRQGIHYLDAVRMGIFCPLGDGGVDLVGVLCELDGQGFDGWAVFEQDVDPERKDTDPLASAIKSRQYLRDAASL